jgi:Tfp pilus assembly protein PilZ
MLPEKRGFPRVNVTCKISVVSGDRPLVLNSHTENLGAGGVRVIIEEKIDYNKAIDLELFLSDREKPLKCKGKVVWVNEIKPTEIKPRLFDTGIQFMEMSDPDRKQIRDFVNTVISKGYGHRV